MKSHPLHLPHPWSHSESPHVALIEAKDAAMVSTQLPAQALPTSYPQIDLYPQEAETTPLLFKAKLGGQRGRRALEVLYRKVSGFLNPPMLGGILAVVAGVIPFLRKTLFSPDAVLSP